MWSKQTTLWCDYVIEENDDKPDTTCSAHITLNFPTVKAAREDAANSGWTHRNGNDYCPEHSENGTHGGEGDD